jgi:small basic protein
MIICYTTTQNTNIPHVRIGCAPITTHTAIKYQSILYIIKSLALICYKHHIGKELNDLHAQLLQLTNANSSLHTIYACICTLQNIISFGVLDKYVDTYTLNMIRCATEIMLYNVSTYTVLTLIISHLMQQLPKIIEDAKISLLHGVSTDFLLISLITALKHVKIDTTYTSIQTAGIDAICSLIAKYTILSVADIKPTIAQICATERIHVVSAACGLFKQLPFFKQCTLATYCYLVRSMCDTPLLIIHIITETINSIVQEQYRTYVTLTVLAIYSTVHNTCFTAVISYLRRHFSTSVVIGNVEDTSVIATLFAHYYKIHFKVRAPYFKPFEPQLLNTLQSFLTDHLNVLNGSDINNVYIECKMICFAGILLDACNKQYIYNPNTVHVNQTECSPLAEPLPLILVALAAASPIIASSIIATADDSDTHVQLSSISEEQDDVIELDGYIHNYTDN